MKKILSLCAFALVLISCQETTTSKADFKTGYIDTSILLEKYNKFTDANEKFKVKSEEMGRPIQAKAQQLEAEMANFQRAAQVNGEAWAQQKYGELQQRQQALLAEREQILGKIDGEAGKLKDSLVKEVKKYIENYGKKEGYDYIFTTSEMSVNVIYAKESYNLTEKILKKLNEEYKATAEKK
ncbi:OmpH family outer membrane protein [Flavobacterium sp. 20NA77.7]|jgi:outer membrane protein|uniref:OmpH family outer membrane protein n=1 Tax=Flavobacterium nakdongensis TaxID=3073563 RepID=A0ABY9RCE7_9FLAO|nr:OmpH family outer membrane protein [Flavobacterium sp. 20NA77.7]WMW77847.1 OmpH family outer membrane protein [Flavobacterium sp. 20NA77.7]